MKLVCARLLVSGHKSTAGKEHVMGMRRFAWVVVCAALVVGAGNPARGALAAPSGFGALGDSLGDEYLFTGKGLAQNYVELGARYRGLNFGSFTTADRGEPRNQGFEYNWASAGLNKPGGILTTDLIPTGQVAGVLGQAGTG